MANTKEKEGDSKALSAFMAKIQGGSASSSSAPITNISESIKAREILGKISRRGSVSTSRAYISRPPSTTSTKARLKMEAVGISSLPWGRIVRAIIGLLAMFSAVYWVTHDTPANRARNEQIFLEGTIEKQKTERIVEQRKMMEIQYKIASLTARPISVADVPSSSSSLQRVVHIPEGAQHMLSKDITFVVPSGISSTSPVARVLFLGVPKRTTGEYMLVLRRDPSQRYWTHGWSTDGSPQKSLDALLANHLQSSGREEVFEVYTKEGQVEFVM